MTKVECTACAKELNLSQKQDGMCWMDYKDFSAIWTYIGACVYRVLVSCGPVWTGTFFLVFYEEPEKVSLAGSR